MVEPPPAAPTVSPSAASPLAQPRRPDRTDGSDSVSGWEGSASGLVVTVGVSGGPFWLIVAGHEGTPAPDIDVPANRPDGTRVAHPASAPSGGFGAIQGAIGAALSPRFVLALASELSFNSTGCFGGQIGGSLSIRLLERLWLGTTLSWSGSAALGTDGEYCWYYDADPSICSNARTFRFSSSGIGIGVDGAFAVSLGEGGQWLVTASPTLIIGLESSWSASLALGAGFRWL